MKKFHGIAALFRAMVVVAILIAVQPVVSADWIKYGANPVLTGTVPTGTPVVLESGGNYKMWYQNDFGIWYATSSDGLDWTPYGTNAVFDVGQMALGTVRYDGIGTYQMWYSTGGSSGRTGYANSVDGVNWIDQGYVLVPGSEAYDAYSSETPFVMLDSNEGIYKMWYTAGASVSVGRTIAYATSADGLSWTKQGVVFTPQGGSWYSWSTNAAYVEKGPSGYSMWFAGGDGASGQVGRVHSTDGINWDYGSVTVELSPGLPGAWDAGSVGNPWLLSTSDGQSLLYYANSGDAIGVAVVPAPGALVSLMTGLVCMGGYMMRRRR